MGIPAARVPILESRPPGAFEGQNPLFRVVFGKIFVLWKAYRKYLFGKFFIAIIGV